MKIFKISLISLVLILLVTLYSLYVGNHTDHYLSSDDIFYGSYQDKDSYLKDYNKVVYPIHKCYPLVLKEDLAIKEYPISYDINIEKIPVWCICRISEQIFYVYDETLGYTSSDDDYNYSFKILFETNSFEPFVMDNVYTVERFYKNVHRDESFYFCEIIYYDSLTTSSVCYASTRFYTDLSLSEEYCKNFVNQNLTFLNL